MTTLRKYSKYFIIVFFVIVAYLSYLLIKPYFVSIAAALIMVYITYPIYQKLNRVIKNKQLCSILLLVLIVIVIIIPAYFLANTLVRESLDFYKNIKGIGVGNLLDRINPNLESTLQPYFEDVVTYITSFFKKSASEFIFSIPMKIISLFVIVIVMYYSFIDGKNFLIKIKDHLPLKEEYKEKILERFKKLIDATIYGVIVVGLVQGAVGTVGLFIFDIPSPLLWGAVMTILAMLPLVGAGWVWLPASLLKIASGDTFNGFGLMLYGFLIVSTIDNLIKPHLISKRAKTHPIVILLGILGGIKLFGLMGIFIGPIILTIFLLFLEIYIAEKNEVKGKGY